MRTNSSYKMSKELKTILAHISDRRQRNDVKRAFIAAELASAIKPKLDKKLIKED